MQRLGQLHTQLLDDVRGLRERFLAKWLPAAPGDGPSDWEHDLKAYCVLSHAAMEEFAEELSMASMAAAKTASEKGLISRGLIALLASYGFTIETEDDEGKDQKRLADLIRGGVKEAARKHGNAVHGNHGFSLKYLRTLLTPVGIDVPDDMRLLTALRLLADARGSFAHRAARRALYQQKAAPRTLAPEDAARAVEDCLELCRLLAERATNATKPAAFRAPAIAPSVPWGNVSATWTFALNPDPMWRNA